jgi:phage shock protein PspC (stress-responsive transcriptional regulator)
MNKTISISLFQTPFILEEKAYEELQQYLNQVEKHFKNNPDKKEIIDDIENSLAQKFTKELKPSKKVISIEIVQKYIKELGGVSEFEDEEVESSDPSSQKKLYRDSDHKVIAGVAAGIGSYFNIKPLWIRLGLILSLFLPFLNGIQILAYILLWIFLPEASTLSQKLQMQGETVDLKNLGKRAKEIFTKSNSGRDFFEEGARKVRIIFSKIWPAITKIIGLIFLIISLAISSFLVVSAGLIMTQNNDAIFNELKKTWEFIGVVSGGFIITLVIASFIFFFGLSLIKRKFILNLWSVVVLFFVFFLGIGVTVFSGIRMDSRIEQIRNDFKVVQVEELKAFQELEIDNIRDIEIIESDQNKLEIISYELSPENHIIWNFDDQTLNLEDIPSIDNCHAFCFDYGYSVKVYASNLNQINLTDSNVRITNYQNIENLNIDMTDSVLAVYDTKIANLSAKLNKSHLIVTDKEVDEAIIQAENESSVRIRFLEKLNIKLRNYSILRYRGEGEIIKDVSLGSDLDTY